MRMVAALLLLLPIWVQAESAKDVCDTAKKYAASIQNQLPMNVDAATRWTGMSAVYSDSTCLINHTNVLDMASLAQEILHVERQRGSQVNIADVRNYISSPSYRDFLVDISKDANLRKSSRILAVPNVVVTTDYFPTALIEPFSITLTQDDL